MEIKSDIKPEVELDVKPLAIKPDIKPDDIKPSTIQPNTTNLIET